jgi:hypothetical protein
MLGSRGWLDDGDVVYGLERLHALDPDRFRGASELVPLVEQLHAMLTAAHAADDGVLLLLDGR